MAFSFGILTCRESTLRLRTQRIQGGSERIDLVRPISIERFFPLHSCQTLFLSVFIEFIQIFCVSRRKITNLFVREKTNFIGIAAAIQKNRSLPVSAQKSAPISSSSFFLHLWRRPLARAVIPQKGPAGRKILCTRLNTRL